MDVLAVSRWREVFETAESRDHRSLNWISVPVSFNSTGLQRLLDEFEPTKAAALYGCWNALLKVAATAPERGVLAGQKGEAYTAGRLARLSGFSQSLFEELIPWCVSVGWLVIAQPVTGLPDRTKPDQTKPNRTGPTKRKAGRSVPDFGEDKTQDGSMLASVETEQRPVRGANNDSDRPPSLTLLDMLRQSELLRKLDAIPVTASGVKIIGPVVSNDRIKREEIERANTEFWWTWYRDQLGSPAVILRAGNMAEAVYVLASVLACKRLKGIENRLALWIKWIKSRECSSITATEWKQATERLARFTSNADLLALTGHGEQSSTESPPTASPERTQRPRMTRADLAARAAELRAKETATT